MRSQGPRGLIIFQANLDPPSIVGISMNRFDSWLVGCNHRSRCRSWPWSAASIVWKQISCAAGGGVNWQESKQTENFLFTIIPGESRPFERMAWAVPLDFRSRWKRVAWIMGFSVPLIISNRTRPGMGVLAVIFDFTRSYVHRPHFQWHFRFRDKIRRYLYIYATYIDSGAIDISN